MDPKAQISRHGFPLLLIASVFLFFGEVIVTGKSLFGSDFVLAFHPWRQYLYEQAASGQGWPLWNPHVLAGTPFLADLQNAMFYPLGFLFYLMPSSQAYGYTVILHWILGSLFMYRFARSMNMGRPGAFLAAFIFSYNGYAVGHLYAGHLTFVQNYIWIPLIFLFTRRFCETGKMTNILWAGLFLGIQILGGFPQIAFYTILALLIFLIAHRFAKPRHEETLSGPQLLRGGLVLLVFGFSLAAVQIFPTYEFTSLSARSSGVTYEFATMDSFHPLHFLTFVMPNWFGSPANGTYWRSPEVWKFWELCGYVGIGPLLVIPFLQGGRGPARGSGFFVFLWAFALFLALGRYNPIYRLIYWLPGFHHFRIPAQILYLHVFAVSVLAGWGLDRLARNRLSPSLFKVVTGTAMALFVLAIVAYLWSPAHFYAFAAAIAGSDGLAAQLGAKMHHSIPRSLFTAGGLVLLFSALICLRKRQVIGATPFVLLFLAATAGDLWSFSLPLVRTTTLNRSQPLIALKARMDTDEDRFRVVTLDPHFPPNQSLLYGFQDIHGYNPMILKRYLEYLNKSQQLAMPAEAVNVRYVNRLDNDLVGLLNVKYAILEDGKLYPTKDYFPRAFIVHESAALPAEQILDSLASGRFDLRKTVLFEEGQHEEGSLSGPTPATVPAETCRVTGFSPNEVVVEAELTHAGYLVLSEINYPGWNAYVDGRRQDCVTGNYLFRTIRLSAGHHEISVKFEPLSLRIGAAATGLAILCFLLIQGAHLFRKRL